MAALGPLLVPSILAVIIIVLGVGQRARRTLLK